MREDLQEATLEVLAGLFAAMQEETGRAVGGDRSTMDAALVSIDTKLTVAIYMVEMLRDPEGGS